RTILPNKGWIATIAFAPDGSMLTVGRRQKTAIVQRWNGDTGHLRELLTFPAAPEQYESAFAFSPDADRLLLQVGDDTAAMVRLLDVATGKPVWETKLTPGRIATRAVFSPDGTTVLVGFCVGTEVTVGATGTAQLFEAATGKPLGPVLDHKRPVFAVA